MSYAMEETQPDPCGDLRREVLRLVPIEAAARELLAAVDFDNNGRMIGMERLGGNGGMISLATSKAADRLRLLLSEGDR